MKGKFLEGEKLKQTLLPGLSLELRVRQGEYRGYYRTKIVDMDDRALVISAPLGEKGFLPLRAEDKIELVFVKEKETFRFESEILERRASDLPTFALLHPQGAKKIQRRRFVRIEYFRNILFQSMNGKKELGAIQDAIALNLSGGGFMFQIDHQLQAGEKAMIYLPVDSEIIEVECVVKRIEEADANDMDKTKYRVSLEFKDLPERVRDKIVKHVFDIERDMRRRGLI